MPSKDFNYGKGWAKDTQLLQWMLPNAHREIKKHPQYKFELFEKSFWTIQIRLRKEFLIGNYL